MIAGLQSGPQAVYDYNSDRGYNPSYPFIFGDLIGAPCHSLPYYIVGAHSAGAQYRCSCWWRCQTPLRPCACSYSCRRFTWPSRRRGTVVSVATEGEWQRQGLQGCGFVQQSFVGFFWGNIYIWQKDARIFEAPKLWGTYPRLPAIPAWGERCFFNIYGVQSYLLSRWPWMSTRWSASCSISDGQTRWLCHDILSYWDAIWLM